MKYTLLTIFLIASVVCFGQSNYINRATRERTIASKADSTFHVPAGTTASLRTGGYTGAGALFYDSTGIDSGLYVFDLVWQRMVKATELANYTLRTELQDSAAAIRADFPDGGGLSGGNLTAEYRLYVPSLSGLKTLTPRWAQLIDSVTTNVIGIGPDSTLVQPKLTISGSLLKNNNTLTFQNDGDYTNRAYVQTTHGTRSWQRYSPLDTANRDDQYPVVWDEASGTLVFRPPYDTAGSGTITGSGTNTYVTYWSGASAITGSSAWTFDGTKQSHTASTTSELILAGNTTIGSLGTNNNYIGSNTYYSSGFKARVTGHTPHLYFPNGDIYIRTSPSTVSAGAASNAVTRIKVAGSGNVALGPNVESATPTAYLHLSNGTATAGTGPLKFTLASAVINTTAEAGVIEPNSSGELFWSPSNSNRRKFVYTNVATPANGQLPIGNGTDYTLANITSPNSTLTVTNGAGSIGLDIPTTVLASANFTATINADPPGFFDNNPVVTVLRANYIRVGAEVNVNLLVSLTHDASATITAFGVQLPIASALTSANQLFGDGTANITASGLSAGADMTQVNVVGDATNDQAIVAFTTSSAGTHFVKVSFTYTIL